MQVAMTEAINLKLSIEEADAVFGRPMGIPKTGVFGLYDLIGIDLMVDVLKSFKKELPDNDDFQNVARNTTNYKTYQRWLYRKKRERWLLSNE